MNLKQLLCGIRYVTVQGDAENTDVKAICIDTRDMIYGSVFVCIEGTHNDSHTMAEQAVYKGASAVVCEKDIKVTKGVTVIKVKSTREALAYMAAAFYKKPANSMIMIGVTGTKGKTTTTYMIEKILNSAGINTGLIGSIEIKYNGITKTNGNTTPEPLTLWETLSDMKQNGVKAVVMEVSSQGLKMERVSGIVFDYAIFTNLSRDHIGACEHVDMEEYRACKTRLFSMCRHGIFNKDDKNTERIINDSGIKSISLYGVGKENDIGEYSKIFTYADHINISLSDGEPGIMFSAHLNDKEGMDYEHMFVLPLPGIFSVYNSLAAVTVCDIILRERDAKDRLKLMSDALCDINVRGRLEVISSDKGFMVIIDYAHNELSLRELLMAMRQYVRGKLITVFGCGGNRSRERRYKMGEVSAELSDFTVITSDNPRYEKPDDIMNDIKQGLLNVFKEDRENDERYVMIQDREKAVRYALSCAEAGDVVIVAGKGHETYQEIMGIRHYMKDSDIVNNYLYGGYNG